MGKVNAQCWALTQYLLKRLPLFRPQQQSTITGQQASQGHDLPLQTLPRGTHVLGTTRVLLHRPGPCVLITENILSKSLDLGETAG